MPPVSRRAVLILSLLAAILTSLPGCGFRLRGALEIPPGVSPLFIQADRGSPVAAALADRLAGGTVVIADRADRAQLVLRILSEQRDSRVVAVDADGRSLARDLRYVIKFDALAADGTPRLAPQTLELVRTFDNPDVEVLGKQLEETLIYQDFATDAADRILMHLRAGLR